MSLALDMIRAKLGTLKAQLNREDLAPLDRGIFVAQRALAGLGLAGSLDVRRHQFFELRQPPPVSRGFRDLVVRTASPTDVRAICAVKGADTSLVEARLRRGDLAYVGVLDDRILCHSFFHRGPSPFTEDESSMARWSIDADTFWSYDAATTIDSRASGVFVKLFQTSLAALFDERGAQRVRCRIDVTNRSSIILHERLGFREIGRALTVTTPIANLVRWIGPGSRSWVLPRGTETEIPLPP